MSDPTKRDAEIIMRLVDAEIKRICNDNDVPNIDACCAECGFIFDLKFGTDCPACHHTGVRWAHLVSAEEIRACMGLRSALDSLTEGETKDISELDRLFALEDTRP